MKKQLLCFCLLLCSFTHSYAQKSDEIRVPVTQPSSLIDFKLVYRSHATVGGQQFTCLIKNLTLDSLNITFDMVASTLCATEVVKHIEMDLGGGKKGGNGTMIEDDYVGLVQSTDCKGKKITFYSEGFKMDVEGTNRIRGLGYRNFRIRKYPHEEKPVVKKSTGSADNSTAANSNNNNNYAAQNAQKQQQQQARQEQQRRSNENKKQMAAAQQQQNLMQVQQAHEQATQVFQGFRDLAASLADLVANNAIQQNIERDDASRQAAFRELSEEAQNKKGELVDCIYCHGRGYEDCYHCSNKGYESCIQCNGTGQLSCMSCGGTGVSLGRTCAVCGGKGKADCTYCSGRGKNVCFYCNGMGHAQCSHCSGTGKEFKVDYSSDDSPAIDYSSNTSTEENIVNNDTQSVGVSVQTSNEEQEEKKDQKYYFEKGNEYYSAHNNIECFKAMQIAADMDNASNSSKDISGKAQFAVVKCYLEGTGTEKNMDKAIQYLLRSADNGYFEAFLFLGGYYEEQIKDRAEAIKWYKKAAVCKDSYTVKKAKEALKRLSNTTTENNKPVSVIAETANSFSTHPGAPTKEDAVNFIKNFYEENYQKTDTIGGVVLTISKRAAFSRKGSLFLTSYCQYSTGIDSYDTMIIDLSNVRIVYITDTNVDSYIDLEAVKNGAITYCGIGPRHYDEKEKVHKKTTMNKYPVYLSSQIADPDLAEEKGYVVRLGKAYEFLINSYSDK